MSLLHSFGIVTPSLTDVLLVKESLTQGILVSKEPNAWYLTFSRGGRRFRWRDGVSTRNTVLARRLTARPSVLAQFLESYGHPGSGAIVFPPSAAARAWAWAQHFPRVIVRPERRRNEDRMYLGLETEEDFRIAFDAVAEAREGGVLVGPYVVGEYFRCVVVGAKLVAAVRVRPAGVIGDGLRTIEQLVELKNRNRGDTHCPLTKGRREMRMLQRQGFTPDSVPRAGVYVQLRDGGELRTGGDALEALGLLKRSEIRQIQDSVAAIPGLRSAEAIVSVPRLPEDDDLKILDLSSTVRLDIYHRPWEGTPSNVARIILEDALPGICD